MSLQRASKNNLAYFAVLVSIATASYVYFHSTEEAYRSITSFEACVKAGYPVLATYPEQCRIPGKSITNPNQKKEEVTHIDTSASTTAYLELSYIINGTPVSIGTTSEELAFTGLTYTGDFNQDGLNDLVFVTQKKIDGDQSDYYLMLALGLHNGGEAASNGQRIGREKPEKIILDRNGLIEVSYLCMVGVDCFYKFAVKNDILEPQQ